LVVSQWWFTLKISGIYIDEHKWRMDNFKEIPNYVIEPILGFRSFLQQVLDTTDTTKWNQNFFWIYIYHYVNIYIYKLILSITIVLLSYPLRLLQLIKSNLCHDNRYSLNLFKNIDLCKFITSLTQYWLLTGYIFKLRRFWY
jgi:hypothetical protein